MDSSELHSLWTVQFKKTFHELYQSKFLCFRQQQGGFESFSLFFNQYFAWFFVFLRLFLVFQVFCFFFCFFPLFLTILLHPFFLNSSYIFFQYFISFFRPLFVSKIFRTIKSDRKKTEPNMMMLLVKM